LYIIFLGAPGAGKGTQASALSQERDLLHIASGDMFRQAIEQETELGLKVKSYVEKGGLVPDELTTTIVLQRLSAPDSTGGAILDGFPRTLRQAEALDKALAGQAKAIDKVVFIKVSEEELLRRLGGRWICRSCQSPYHLVNSPPQVPGKCDKCGGELYQRQDDTPEAIKKRLNVYFSQTAPLIDYYRATGKLLEVDGEGDANLVRGRIAAAIPRKMPTGGV
jgi:adenylate kinase